MLLSIYELSLSVYIITNITSEQTQFIQNLDEDAKLLYMTSVIVILIISALVSVTISNLFGFHIYLQVKHITTYEYILERRKRKHVGSRQDTLQEIYEPYVENNQAKGNISNSMQQDSRHAINPEPEWYNNLNKLCIVKTVHKDVSLQTSDCSLCDRADYIVVYV